MRKRNVIILFISLFSVFHFSPIVAGASGEETESEPESEKNEEEIDREESELIDNESKDVEQSSTDINKSEETRNELENESDGENSSKEAKEQEAEIEDEFEELNEKEEKPSDEESQEDSDVKESEISVMSANEVEPYHPGDRGLHVSEFKRNLVRLGFVNWSNPSESYGQYTAEVVEDFQTYYNLPVTGIADESTRSKVSEVLNPPYQSGDRGEPIVELKTALVELDLVSWSNPSQFYGSNTARVVEDFQRAYGLSADGIAGTDTLDKIEEALSGPLLYHPGDRGSHVSEFKRDLVRLGFVNWSNPSESYGQYTAEVVKDFQSYYNLPVTGFADDVTRAKVSEVLNPPYQVGDRGESVVELKSALDELDFVNWSNPSQYYGSNAAGVVKDFQRAYGLTVDGIAGPDTLTMIEEALSGSLPYHIGDRGSHVSDFKADLVRLGFVNWSNPSQSYGEYTAEIVKDFQSYYNLPVTGIADKVTRAKVSEVLNPPYQTGDRGEPIVELKTALDKLDFVNWSNPSEYYGSNTARVVADFQESYGIEGSGIADTDTLAKIEEALNKPESFHIGDSGPHVSELKADLVRLGFVNWSNPSESYGQHTAEVVKDFQSYYNLPVTGVADDVTRTKVTEVLNPPYQIGDRGEPVVELKSALDELDYVNWSVPSQYYGSNTARAVREFQRVNGLDVTGIANELTLAKLEELMENTTYIKYDISLEEALDIQMNQLQQTDIYRNNSAYVSANYMEVTGTLTGNSNVRVEPTTNSRSITLLSGGSEVTILDEINGQTVSNKDTWYKVDYNGNEGYIHSSLLTDTTAKVNSDVNLNVRANSNASSHIYGVLEAGEKVKVESLNSGWIQINYGPWRNPSRADVKEYLNPDNNDIFQHLELDSSVGVSASELNNVLIGKGKLTGQGQAFIDAGKKYSVNEIYLISHALLETGHGISNLATGIEVGLNSSGNPVLVTNSNKNDLTDIKTTYNMFGIGAADVDPDRLGAIHAYENDWFTPEDAIVGGAQFIEDSYIHNDYNQNTLYKMRWNPENPGYPQYATDIQWATKQAPNIKNLYDLLDNPVLKFNIVQYS